MVHTTFWSLLPLLLFTLPPTAHARTLQAEAQCNATAAAWDYDGQCGGLYYGGAGGLRSHVTLEARDGGVEGCYSVAMTL